MVGPRTKRMSSRLANPKYSNPQEEEEDDDSGDAGRRRPPAKRSGSARESTTRKTPTRKKSKDQPSVPLPRNELDAPEDGYWDDSGKWVEGPRPASAAGSMGDQQAAFKQPTNTNLPPPPPLTAAQRVKARLAASFPSYDEILPKPPPPPPPPALGTRARAKTEYRTSTVTESSTSTTYRQFKAHNGAH
ncbi:uncharacterized protein LOC62_06G008318 [Vanrija pseudolonga]|uniref:Uncharacterized protein n=1 Tax=Vanrija pseudolonga TaxID=143232 RepID=A0AAF1BL86_9TREE|nr:hypothetical protein LOC62_06G008318 [Vanrija pseudolonga]